MTDRETPLERAAFVVLAACLGLVQFNLLAAETLFGVAALMWLAIAVRDGGRPAVPSFFYALAGYAAWTLVSAAFSRNPTESFIDCKQLVLFLMVPMAARLCRGERAMTTLSVIIAFGAVGAIIGVIQATMFGYDNLSKRPDGSLSLYMTYSGIIMLVLCATVARLLFYSQQRIWPAVALPALAIALALTLTRNAWLGAAAGIGILLGIQRKMLLVVVPLIAVLIVAVGPQSLRDRALSSFTGSDPATRDRLAMLQMGPRIIADHPLTGVGPDQITHVYEQYRPPTAVNKNNPHLHNVPLQIAAERGIPALLLWLLFIALALRDLWRQTQQGPARAVAAAGLAAITAMLVAGMFEHNFGDSEFLILFLGLITLPFAARLTDERTR
jgi:putative inorganic carbon (hco3(-)) transporter